ncbi:organic cation transporter protein-like [Hyalella azteca]|uniref:Organic cation transporter protein-like n=1 Tax=Hyalella azteca TaxID=294128 RepID=A0A979FU33_HYAAZ|nr:organic cation transporter protein-like [Hyalella azteca]
MLSASYVVPAVSFSCADSATNAVHEEANSFSSLHGGHYENQSNFRAIQKLEVNSSVTVAKLTDNNQCQYLDEALGQDLTCKNFIFDDSVFRSTITSDYELVCSRSYLRPMYTSLYMFGAMFGSAAVGYMADWKGRKLPMTVGIIGYALTPVALSVIPSLEVILFCRLLLGFFHPILLTSFYTIALEVSQPKYRATVGVLAGLPWALGTIAWAGLGYLIRDWQWLMLTATVPSFFFLPCIWLIDESPRWLVVHGHHDKAIEV